MSKELKEIPAVEEEAVEQSLPKQTKQREISHFEIDVQGLNKISEVLNELIPSKYVKQVIIIAIDDNVKPVYKT